MSIYPLEGLVNKVKFSREAAAVRRCHTLPIIGEYIVGGHSYNMLTMLRLLHPDPPIRLVWAIQEHDVPERLTGDIPAPTKWFKIVDKEHLTAAEMDINEQIFGWVAELQLTEEDLKWLKGLDILELYLFCKDQLMMGNQNMLIMKGRIERFINREKHLFAPEVLNFYFNLQDHSWQMCPDLGDLE